MRRRDFLRDTLAGTAVALVSGAPPIRATPTMIGGLGAHTQAGWVDVEDVTVADLQEHMAAGRFTSEQLVLAYLGRIESLDRAGPRLNSIIEVNPDALAIARELDEERAGGRVRGPLHGIPIAIKDNIDTGDRMLTTAGSLALLDAPTPRDAFIVERLREAGAVLLAKTNLSEWANMRSTRSSSGWSGRGGQTLNPYVLDRSPCGSSSGSGAAVSASLCAIAIGTETDGSIVCPANACGIVGIKPTLGLWSRAGIIPLAHSQDTAGPMARTVADAAVLLGALAGVDPRDPDTEPSAPYRQPDYTQYLDAGGLRGARIGVVRGFFGFHEQVDALIEEAIEAMRQAGAVIVDPAEIPNTDEYRDTENEVLLYELKADMASYLRARGGSMRSLADLIAFNERNRDREMPYFGQELFHMAESKGPLTDQAYLDALANNRRYAGPEGIDQVLREHDLAALVAPTDGPAWPIDLVTGDHFLGGSSSPGAVAGYPSITVPAGYVFGLPVGISFIGTAWSEPSLIRLAHSYERATGHRVVPTFRSTVQLT